MDQFYHESMSTCKSVECQPPSHSRRRTFISCHVVGGLGGQCEKEYVGDSRTIQEAPDPKEGL